MYDIVYDIVYDILFVFIFLAILLQIRLINSTISNAKAGNPMYQKQLAQDPSEKLIEVHVAALKWNMQSRTFEMTGDKLKKLQDQSVSLLELLKTNLPVKSGEKSAWKFEIVHIILHKVRELILFGWSENFSTQGPEHCHVDFVIKVAEYTNNKDTFLCVLSHHVREGQLQYLHQLQTDLAGEEEIEPGVVKASLSEDWLAN